MVAFQGINLAALLATFAIIAIACLQQLQYGELRPLRNGLFLPLFDAILTNRRMVQGGVDLISAALSICLAFLIHDVGSSETTRAGLRTTGPVIVLIQIACLAISGLYRRAFRHPGIPDLLAVIKALVVAASFSWIGSLIIFSRQPPPLAVSIVDGYLLITFVVASRFSFSMLDYLFKSESERKCRVLIYGAAAGGAAACREIQSRPELDKQVLGFIDDDAAKTGQLLNGVPVLHTDECGRMLDRHAVDEVILTSSSVSGGRVQQLVELCVARQIRLSRYVVEFEEVLDDSSTLSDSSNVSEMQAAGK
jgi:FlaA1/EpsC-like NDP-sugar epimerase